MPFAAVAVVWAVLLGAAYAARRAGLSRGRTVALTAACYVALAVLALRHFGLTGRGLLAVGGMLVPLLVATLLVMLGGGARGGTNRGR